MTTPRRPDPPFPGSQPADRGAALKAQGLLCTESIGKARDFVHGTSTGNGEVGWLPRGLGVDRRKTVDWDPKVDQNLALRNTRRPVR